MKRSILSWLLFIAFVSVPSALLVYGTVRVATLDALQRLARGEQDRLAAARLLRRDVELARLRSDETVRNIPEDAPAVVIEATLLEGRPPFGEVFVLAPDGALVVPRAGEGARAVVAPLLDQLHVHDPSAPRAPHWEALEKLRKAGMVIASRTAMPFIQQKLCEPASGKWCIASFRRFGDGGERGYLVTEDSLVRGAATILGPDLVLQRMPPASDDADVYAVEDPLHNKLSVALPRKLDSEDILIAPSQDVFRVAHSPSSRMYSDIVTRRRQILFTGLFAVALFLAVASVLFVQKRRAQRLADLRTDFVAAVSHELRTPLASVRMLAELLEAGVVVPGERPEVERTLAGEARRLGATLERMLRFGALARGKLVVEKQRVRLAPLLEDAVKRFRTAHPDRAVVVDVDASLEADVDGGLVGLALDNLLGNAAKYAPEGGPYRVSGRRASDADRQGGPYRITGRRVAQDVLVSVADQGPGLDRKARERIFMPFERADDRLSRATEGTGVGLALVRGIAQAHGGDASVSSEPDKGATFVLRFPSE